MPYFSNLQQLLTGLALSYSGYGLAFQPTKLFVQLSPLLKIVGTPSTSTANLPTDSFLPIAGIGLLALGYFYVTGVYTQDEKFKRNSVPGRFILAFVTYYITTLQERQTSINSSIATPLLKLFTLFNLVTGIVMGLSIGFQDGNQVDIDEEEKQKQVRKKWRAREAELLDKLKQLEAATQKE